MQNTVLIIDEELLVNKLLEARLIREDLIVEIAVDGEEALNKIGSKRYDLILTDLMVPLVAGQELLMQIQNSDLNAGTPIIVLSSLSSEEMMVDVLSTGVKDYIVKPFSVDVVIAKIKQLLIPNLSLA